MVHELELDQYQRRGGGGSSHHSWSMGYLRGALTKAPQLLQWWACQLTVVWHSEQRTESWDPLGCVCVCAH